MRVRTLIENDEPGIDVQRSRIFLHGNRVGMSTCVLVLLKERQLMVSGQVISGGKAGNTTPYDCYVHHVIKSLNILDFVVAARAWFVRLPITVIGVRIRSYTFLLPCLSKKQTKTR